MSVYWPVPRAVPPRLYARLATTGDCTVRASAEAWVSHGVVTVGSNVSPLGRTILTGTRNVLMVVEGAVCVTNGFLPTIVTLNFVPASLTVVVNRRTEA